VSEANFGPRAQPLTDSFVRLTAAQPSEEALNGFDNSATADGPRLM